MILAQLLTAFPGCHFSTRAVSTSWEVCLLHGPLQPGMHAWLSQHNLTAQREPGVDGYVIRWLSGGPDFEKRVFATIKRFADLGYRHAQRARLFSDSELRGYDKQINEFIVNAQELGL